MVHVIWCGRGVSAIVAQLATVEISEQILIQIVMERHLMPLPPFSWSRTHRRRFCTNTFSTRIAGAAPIRASG
jgi:hypothetical protein